MFVKKYAWAAFQREIWEVEPSGESGRGSKILGRMLDGNRMAIWCSIIKVQRCRSPSGWPTGRSALMPG